MAQVVLASQSPRRRELLSRIFAEFEVIPSGVEETADAACPRDYVIALASAKAQDVASRCPRDTLVIGSDTVVVLDNVILEKPKDEEDAFRMLSSMSGRMHEVYTGVALCKDGETHADCEVTRVWFRDLGEDAIKRYIASGEPMDKAGAYGIQQMGALLVKGIEGDYFNVVGLPLCKLCEMLEDLGCTTL